MDFPKFLASKVLLDGSIVLAFDHYESVVLVHQVLTSVSFEIHPVSRFSWHNGDPLTAQIKTQTVRTLLITREEFEAGGYEGKVYENKNVIAQTLALPNPG